MQCKCVSSKSSIRCRYIVVRCKGLRGDGREVQRLSGCAAFCQQEIIKQAPMHHTRAHRLPQHTRCFCAQGRRPWAGAQSATECGAPGRARNGPARLRTQGITRTAGLRARQRLRRSLSARQCIGGRGTQSRRRIAWGTHQLFCKACRLIAPASTLCVPAKRARPASHARGATQYLNRLRRHAAEC